jgi:formylglycine-generating enzyme required for sulfatase activity
MACIPHGWFSMGTNDSSYDGANPQHPVEVSAFQMDLTEVTVAAYRACEDAGYCGPAEVSNNEGDSTACAAALADHDDYPVDCVTLFDAARFCAWRGKRLPSEPEWEYAAQRPGGRIFPWGDDELSVTRVNACGRECDPSGLPWDDGFPNSAPVGSFPAGRSFDGLLDLAGNVWEWTSSQSCPYPAGACQACAEGSPDCSTPCETCGTIWPVARGGGSGSRDDHDFRVYERGIFNPYNQWAGTGLRCAK